MSIVGRYVQEDVRTNRLGIDFGTATLVICRATEDGGFKTTESPGMSLELPVSPGETPVHVFPSLIHYDALGTPAFGSGVTEAGDADRGSTVRWLRNYLLEGSAVQIPAGNDRRVTVRDAAAEFLCAALTRVVREHPGTSSAVFTLPPNTPAWYPEWLGGVARAAGIGSWETIDETSAIFAGYGVVPEEGRTYFIIRWDETDLSIIAVDWRNSSGADTGELRVTDIVREAIGCRDIVEWIVQDVLFRSRIKFAGAKGVRMHRLLVATIEEQFNTLGADHETMIRITDPVTGTGFTGTVSPHDIARILAERGFPSILDRAVRCTQGVESGRNPAAILLTGRGCALPAVRDVAARRFAGVPVHAGHPIDAAAGGAAIHTASLCRHDRIRNDYALRYWDAGTREHRYRFLVRSGARFPSAGQVARITISAAYDGQSLLGLPVYELATSADAAPPALELVSDTTGGVRLACPAKDAGRAGSPRLANGGTPTLIRADPPALKGEPRFELTFVLDGDKTLRVTARDLVTGKLVRQNTPVHKLT